MKPSKTNHTRWMAPHYFHIILIYCVTLPIIHTEHSTCTLVYSHPLKECITTHQQDTQYHSLPHTRNPYVPCSTATKVHNITHTWTCHTNTTLLMDSTASAQRDRPHLPCSAIKLQPPTTWLLFAHQRAHQHALQSWAALYPPHGLPQPSYVHK